MKPIQGLLTRRIRRLLEIASVFLIAALPLQAQVVITLKNSFIDKYKNRATIDATFVVDKAHAQPNPAAKDGDLHIAGRADEIGLATVAEIMNAAKEKTAVDAVHEAERDPEHKPVSITGAWRLWCEHGGNVEQTQGDPLTPFTTTNPFHVFEIHPITHLADQDLRASLTPIIGFATKDAETAFTAYENRSSHLAVTPDTTSITTNIVGYNYVEFWITPTEAPHDLPDGKSVFAEVQDADGNPIVRNRRMIFVAGSAPEQALQTHKTGSMHVLGIPRIDLALVAWRRDNATTRPEVLDWNLPYEMIVVAAYPGGNDATSTPHHAKRPKPATP